jgi:polygalacturonase
MNFTRQIVFLLLLSGMPFFLCFGQNRYPYASLYKDLPFEMPKVQRPIFPDRQLSVTECGGVGDGITLNTQAFAQAMKVLSEKGGGTLQVPFGVWYTGPIEFRSNVNLHLDKGALILFTTDYDAYPLISTSYEGIETRRCQSPISARNLENIAITGEGSINGNGQAWRPLKRAKVTEAYWKSVVQSGGVLRDENYWLPSAKSLLGEKTSGSRQNNRTEEEWQSIKDFLRPVMISLVECKNVLLEGVLFENSPSWNIHPLMCENIIIDGVSIRNPSFAQNGDGLDLESCKNALIINSTLEVGDDAICLKSGRDAEGRRRGRPTENVIVNNCKVFKAHGGFVVGSEMSGGVRNISVSDCLFLGTDIGLRFKSNRGRGGVVENIYVNRISMFDIVADSFLFDLYYGGKSASESLEDDDVTSVEEKTPDVTEKTPVFRNIYVKNLVSRNARRAMFFNGLPEMNISNIHVENTEISAQYGAEISESDGIIMKNVTILAKTGAPLILKNAKNLKLNGFSCSDTTNAVVAISGIRTRNINLSSAIKKENTQIKTEGIGQEIKYLK